MIDRIIELYKNRPQDYSAEDYNLITEFMDGLNDGKFRACEPADGFWKVNSWVKMGILLGFRMGTLIELPWSEKKNFFDKHTLPERQFSLSDQIRIVPGGSSARNGCYLARGVTVMPPAFINVGAYIDSGSLIDSHALVGSCAQIGKNVHLSAGAMIGGVLEPVGSRPVVIGDEAFVGGNTGIYEGIIVQNRAIIASGTIITASTPIYDNVKQAFLAKDEGGSFTIPEGAVVVPGSRSIKNNPSFQIYCPIIIKYRDDKTELSVQLEHDLREIIG